MTEFRVETDGFRRVEVPSVRQRREVLTAVTVIRNHLASKERSDG